MVQLRSLSISANAAEAFQKIQNPRYLLSNKLHHRHSLYPLRRGIHTHPQVLHHILRITTWSNLSIILLLSNSIAFDPTCTNALYCASISTASLYHYSSTLSKRPIAPPHNLIPTPPWMVINILHHSKSLIVAIPVMHQCSHSPLSSSQLATSFSYLYSYQHHKVIHFHPVAARSHPQHLVAASIPS